LWYVSASLSEGNGAYPTSVSSSKWSGLAAAVLALQLQAENIRSPALRIALLHLAPISADLPITGG
jgi:hypothetical protein